MRRVRSRGLAWMGLVAGAAAGVVYLVWFREPAAPPVPPSDLSATLVRAPGAQGFDARMRNVSRHPVWWTDYRPAYAVRYYDRRGDPVPAASFPPWVDPVRMSEKEWTVLAPGDERSVRLWLLDREGQERLEPAAVYAECEYDVMPFVWALPGGAARERAVPVLRAVSPRIRMR